MKRWLFVIAIGLVLSFLSIYMQGCTKTIIVDVNDPNNPIVYYSADPNVLSAIDTGANIGEKTAPLITTVGITLFPQYAGILTLVGGLIGYGINLWRKLNPVLQRAYTKNQILQTTLAAVVKAVEAAGEANNSMIKENVADNLAKANLITTGKILITEAKAAQ